MGTCRPKEIFTEKLYPPGLPGNGVGLTTQPEKRFVMKSADDDKITL
jgi:hypothetical protein